jgi:methylmalonyl-CoA/ethylmalonyl-CoA epimerase
LQAGNGERSVDPLHEELSMLGEFAALGPVGQIAYVDADMEAAVRFWTRTVGAGPFYLFEHPHMDVARYRGQPVQLDISIALGYWNDLQIEIIQQHNQSPSIYIDQQRAGDKNLNHICIYVDDLAQAREVCKRTNSEIVQEMYVNGKGGLYADAGGSGRLIECAVLPPAFADAVVTIRQASRGWDGSDPLRILS